MGMPPGLTMFFDNQLTVYAIVAATFATIHGTGIMSTLALLREKPKQVHDCSVIFQIK